MKRLGDVVSITGGGTPSRSRKDFWNGNIPWVSSSDVSDESIHELKITRWITSEAVSSSATKIVPENSILLVSRVGVGKVAISRIPVCTSQDFTNLTPHRDDFIFLGYYLSAWAYVLKSFGQGMAIQGFKKQDIENLAIPLPDANSGEQQKIADCLSSLDELIELQAKQLEALKAHKKGLMQQLFPQEIDL
ncbi:MAG: restriction endonuclease subunit S [Meiothermus silvanus]|nr:restriction endonuclease subunit S [Allomeiothermus silvanus]